LSLLVVSFGHFFCRFVALCRSLSLVAALCRFFSLSPNNLSGAIIQKTDLKKGGRKTEIYPFYSGKWTLNGRNFNKGVCLVLNYSASRTNQYPLLHPTLPYSFWAFIFIRFSL
jgi:hypothetical protein